MLASASISVFSSYCRQYIIIFTPAFDPYHTPSLVDSVVDAVSVSKGKVSLEIVSMLKVSRKPGVISFEILHESLAQPEGLIGIRARGQCRNRSARSSEENHLMRQNARNT